MGGKYEEKLGDVVVWGLGGMFVEVVKEVWWGVGGLCYEEGYWMIDWLGGYKIIKGRGGEKGVNEERFGEIIVGLWSLVGFGREIKEMDMNGLLGREK